jgi:hypothetical protein
MFKTFLLKHLVVTNQKRNHIYKIFHPSKTVRKRPYSSIFSLKIHFFLPPLENMWRQNRFSCSTNKQLEQKIIMWTSQRLTADDGCLYFHIYRTAH